VIIRAPQSSSSMAAISALLGSRGQPGGREGNEQLKQTATEQQADAQQRGKLPATPRVRRPLRRCRFTTVTPVGQGQQHFGEAGGADSSSRITRPRAISGNQRSDFGHTQGRQAQWTATEA